MLDAQDWLDAQVGVIGSVLISPELAPKVIATTREDDYTGHFRTIFGAIKSLFMQGKPADVVLIREALGKEYTQILMDSMDVTPTANNIDFYIQACRDRGKLYRLRDLGQQLQEAQELQTATALLECANKSMVDRSSLRITTMEQALGEFFDRHEGCTDYLPWPIDGLQQVQVEAGDFVVIGGYPSDGKTALALQLAWTMAEKKRVGFFSLETSDRKLFDRLMASVARIQYSVIRKNSLSERDWTEAGKRSQEISGRKLEIIPAGGMMVPDIRAISYAQRYDVIFVDYIQLIPGEKGKDRYSVVTETSIGLHNMSQSTGITVFALAQLSRPEKGDKAKAKAPTLHSLRESGQIEQDADVVMLLYRERQDMPQRNLDVLKNKDGPLMKMVLDFDGQYQTFVRNQADKYQATQAAIRRSGQDARQFRRLPDDTPVPFEQQTMEGV